MMGALPPRMPTASSSPTIIRAAKSRRDPRRHHCGRAGRGRDRRPREAIRRAIAELQSGDVLLIAGKGHETGQIVGDQILPFTDHEAVATALKELAA